MHYFEISKNRTTNKNDKKEEKQQILESDLHSVNTGTFMQLAFTGA